MITVQVDSFRDCLEELKLIFPLHWEELALFKNRMPLAPQFEEYMAREQAGRLLLVTVRIDGKIAAYYTIQVAPGFHYGQTLTGTMDMMYVVPEQRGRGLAFPLLRRVEAELKRRGVQIWYSGFKSHNSLRLPELLGLMGFVPADQYHAKWIGT